MKYFFIAGERSGDLHASNLIKELKRRDYEAEIVGYGGDMMEEEGMGLLCHYREYSFMGLWEVLKHLGTVRNKLAACKKAIREHQPDVLVLVDFPGFNLRMARYARSLGIKTCYYISPKIWAWKKGRIKTIREVIDKMLVIIPFEVEFYRKLNYEVEYVGNPLMDSVRTHNFDPIPVNQNRPAIALLPGSRTQELRAATPVILEMAHLRPDYQFLLAGVDNLNQELYTPFKGLSNVSIYFGRTYDILKSANAAMVTSGTATLQACLLSAPQVVVYRTSRLTYEVGKRLVKVGFISLVNLIAGKEVVRELIQQEFNANAVLAELESLINDPNYCGQMMAEYQDIKEKIGFEPASKRAADAMAEWLNIDS